MYSHSFLQGQTLPPTKHKNLNSNIFHGNVASPKDDALVPTSNDYMGGDYDMSAFITNHFPELASVNALKLNNQPEKDNLYKNLNFDVNTIYNDKRPNSDYLDFAVPSGIAFSPDNHFVPDVDVFGNFNDLFSVPFSPLEELANSSKPSNQNMTNSTMPVSSLQLELDAARQRVKELEDSLNRYQSGYGDFTLPQHNQHHQQPALHVVPCANTNNDIIPQQSNSNNNNNNLLSHHQIPAWGIQKEYRDDDNSDEAIRARSITHMLSVETKIPRVVGRLSPKEREAKLERYRQKRARRHFGKKIRYQCRKKLADTRPRFKGRFCKEEPPLTSNNK